MPFFGPKTAISRLETAKIAQHRHLEGLVVVKFLLCGFQNHRQLKTKKICHFQSKNCHFTPMKPPKSPKITTWRVYCYRNYSIWIKKGINCQKFRVSHTRSIKDFHVHMYFFRIHFFSLKPAIKRPPDRQKRPKTVIWRVGSCEIFKNSNWWFSKSTLFRNMPFWAHS